MDDLGGGVIDALGEPAARELLDAITRSDADRAALIGRLYACAVPTVPLRFEVTPGYNSR